jgi:RecA/RadA recombinase
MTNQVQSIPTSFGNSENSTGGNILDYISTHRVRLNKSDFGNVYATIVKSPYLASDAPDAKFIITKRGIDDLPTETWTNCVRR